MDPRARLSAGQLAASEGRYEEALREYVWFHDHALEHRPSLYGVRLSFALGYWMDLAKVYPEARRRLLEIRDRKAETLASGRGDRDLFHDVESINQTLGEEEETYRLFLTMLKTSPLLAPACADLAVEAIVKAGNFRLAETYSQVPEDALIRYSDQLNRDVADLNRRGERKTHVLDAYVHIYCDRVGTTIAILKGLRKIDEAALCREWAEVLVESAAVRKRVQKKLEERYDA